MPSSDPTTIPYVLRLVSTLEPESILDVGAGNGRYGFLFRELLDMNYARFKQWKYRIDAVEIETDYLNPVHNYVYNNVFIGDWLDVEIAFHYDLVFMGDVLEHFRESEWQDALKKARDLADTVIVVSPNWDGSSYQKAWHGYEHETHHVELSPEKVGGKCLFANSKSFMSVFGSDIVGKWDILL
jgi:hypothetical protein